MPQHPLDVAGLLAGRRAELTSRIGDLARDAEAMIAAALDANLDDEHDPEGATVAFEREQLGALLAAARAALAEVDTALARVAAGRYGWCLRCGEPIPTDRLAARPTATSCLRCAGAPRR